MSEQNKPSETDNPSEAQEIIIPSPNDQPPRVEAQPSYSLYFCGFISLLALAASGYIWLDQREAIHQQSILSNQFQEEINQQNQKINATIDSVDATDLALQHAQTEISEQLNRLQDQQKKNSAYLQSHEIWRLYEAEYLIDTAHWKLAVNNDAKTAIALLSSADQQIQILNNPAFTDLRKALIEDIAALQVVPTIDQEGIILRLNELLKHIYRLPPQNQITTEKTSTSPTTANTTNVLTLPFWQKTWENLIQNLKEIVHVRRNDQPFEPLLSELQQTQLLQTMHLLIQQAQFAVINYDETLYNQSLKQLDDLLKRFFTPDNAEIKFLLDQINQLIVINVSPTLPEITHSLTAIRHAIEQGVTP